ncbi:pyridoxal phosphate-dependent aminotransferase [Nocardia aurantia]|uniref:Aminotransferase n=1 Tax=Nocardia aurantia TaxID=2585199 RepID=A0A7K0DJ23_9NOCA|nr:pyridoxal phosphate-dependent aminotransferase [Nocardia aurantia]MQY25816.1 Aspartate aminotransferase [Nocardia aurantia]
MTATVPAPSFEALLNRPGLAWMGQNTTHLEPPPEVLEALTDSIRRREFQWYAPALGLSELRALIAEDLGLPGAEVLITDGAVGGLHHLCTALAPRISRLITTDPGWPWPGRFLTVAGVPVTTVEIYSAADDYKLPAERLAEVIEPRALIYLIDPLNPLGSRYTEPELRAITDLAREHEAILVHDCTYRHFATGHTLAAALYPEGTLTTYSFSKWLGLAGLRLGALVGSPELTAGLAAVPSNPLGANIQAQRAAIAGLRVRDAWLARLTATDRRNQRVITDAITGSGLGRILVDPSHGNFLAVDIAESGWNADALSAALLDEDIFVRAGTYQSPAFGDRFVKISTSVPPQWADRLAVVWSSLAERKPR